MAGISGALEVLFSLSENERYAPLYFHHIPKTGGTSFRAAISASLRGSPRFIVPDVRPKLSAIGAWPQMLQDVERRCRSFGQVRAFVSHYTAQLGDALDEPVLSIVREPEAHFMSTVAFHLPAHVAKNRSARDVARSAGNRQIRSLTGAKPPYRQPDDLAPWTALVDEVLSRSRLFRLEEAERLSTHCHDVHGIDVNMKVKKTGSAQAKTDPLTKEVERLLAKDDPVWLDRLLYIRAAG